MVGSFVLLSSFTESEEELKQNLLRRKRTLTGVRGLEASGAKSLPQQREMHSSNNVGLPTYMGCSDLKDRALSEAF